MTDTHTPIPSERSAVSFELPLGAGTVEVSLPDCDVTIGTPPGGEPVEDVREAAERALDSPLGPALEYRVTPDADVAIVVTDVTRATPDGVLLDAMLDRLRAAGVDREQVTVVLGLGLHRPMDDDEIESALGEHADLAVNHDPDAAIPVAGKVDGVPVEVHPAVANADVVLSTGMVEPHQYAGFSGGAKTVVVGAGGEPMIRYTHGPDLLGQDGVRLGRVDGNPFREAIDRAGELAGPDFCVNVTHGPQGILDVAAGNPRAVVRDLAASARAALSVELSETYDAVVAGVGAPKDANLYQTTRAATYVALGDYDPLRSDGRVVIPADLPEGVGQGTGEQRFYQWVSNAKTAQSLYEAMSKGYEPGAQRAFVLARVLREYDVYVTNSQHPEIVEECLMHARESVENAVEPGSDVLVVPDALNTLLVSSSNR
ncbi:lactate racemase domain-containing protein [Haloarculaceae archaeon H-GB1-1]|nr:lactate racemase domain-containing protein [Haloarculaceae archaeon H-GB1-1]